MESNKRLGQVLTDLRLAIDQIDSSLKNARDLILELARTLDESGECERRSVSRKIKELLADKIQEGKITAKWIHGCLPSEYKREYKREVTSLSYSDIKNKEINIDSRSDVIVQGIEGNDIHKNDDNDESLDKGGRQEETKKIIMDVHGMPVEEKNLELTPPLFPTTDNNSIANADDVLKPHQKGKQIKPDLECPSCQELYTEVIELREAVKKATKLQTADDMLSGSESAEQHPKHPSSVSSVVVTIPPVGNRLDSSDGIKKFEFSLLFGDISKYMARLYQKIGEGGKIWFSGRIDTKTGRVISANLGRINQEQQQ